MRVLDRVQPLALLVMRLVLGVIFIAHSYHKVFGGMKGVEGFLGSMGLPWWSAYLSAYTEFFGGILLIVGLVTRVVGVGLCIDMCVAIAKVHWKHGLLAEGGYQFPLALAALAFALIFFGGGPIALDHVIRGGGGTPSRK